MFPLLPQTEHRKTSWVQPSKLCISPLCVIWSKMPGDVFLLNRLAEEVFFAAKQSDSDQSSDHQKEMYVLGMQKHPKKTEIRL